MISIVLVMFVLPQILLLGGKIIAKTSFAMPSVSRERQASGLVAVDGLIHGEIRGTVYGVFRGTINGDVIVQLVSGKMEDSSLLPEHKEKEGNQA